MRTALRHPWVSWFSGLVNWSWGTPVLAVLLSFFFFEFTTVSSIYFTINIAVHSLQRGGPTLDYRGKQWRSWLFAYSVVTTDELDVCPTIADPTGLNYLGLSAAFNADGRLTPGYWSSWLWQCSSLLVLMSGPPPPPPALLRLLGDAKFQDCSGRWERGAATKDGELKGRSVVKGWSQALYHDLPLCSFQPRQKNPSHLWPGFGWHLPFYSTTLADTRGHS